MPAGGFGNLIALPLQKRPREHGNSVLLDDAFCAYDDQWAYLSTIRRLSRSEMMTIVGDAGAKGQILGVRLPITDDADEPWAARPSRRGKDLFVEGTLPASVDVVLGNQVYIDRSNLPPALVSRIVRLAAFQNPEFYAAQAMRLPTFGKPRIISCAELHLKHVALPRGCLDEVLALLGEVGVAAELRDERQEGQPVGAGFLGELTPEQDEAASALLRSSQPETAARSFSSIAASSSTNGWRGYRPFWTSRRIRSASFVAARRSLLGLSILP
jgi:hypothetical protein